MSGKFFRICQLTAVSLIILGASKSFAAERASATADFYTGKSRLNFSREGEPVRLRSYRVPIVFKIAQNSGSIENELMGKGHKNSSFAIVTTIRVTGDLKSRKGYSICDWNYSKTVARCAIESDGGSFALQRLKTGRSLRTSKFALIVIKNKDFNGFYLSLDEAEPDASVLVSVKRGTRVEVPVQLI